jgi:hypothetical protein
MRFRSFVGFAGPTRRRWLGIRSSEEDDSEGHGRSRSFLDPVRRLRDSCASRVVGASVNSFGAKSDGHTDCCARSAHIFC